MITPSWLGSVCWSLLWPGRLDGKKKKKSDTLWTLGNIRIDCKTVKIPCDCQLWLCDGVEAAVRVVLVRECCIVNLIIWLRQQPHSPCVTTHSHMTQHAGPWWINNQTESPTVDLPHTAALYHCILPTPLHSTPHLSYQLPGLLPSKVSPYTAAFNFTILMTHANSKPAC